jgi:2-polyprenyl-3-methyl-5-hydroxy-6-metoxy-1,4-benzoquinol methylase
MMDEEGVDPTLHREALRGLHLINYLTNSYRLLWQSIRQLPVRAHVPLRILDVACGGGDTLQAIAKYASQANIPVHITGIDISPTAIQVAQEACAHIDCPQDWIMGNALLDQLPENQDVVFCSLFLHHLSNEDAVLLLQRMSQVAIQRVIVADLIRSTLGYMMVYAGTRLLSRNKIVHVDGIRSIEAALTIKEAQGIALKAGLTTAKVQRFWPERFVLEWSPQADAVLSEMSEHGR